MLSSKLKDLHIILLEDLRLVGKVRLRHKDAWSLLTTRRQAE